MGNHKTRNMYLARMNLTLDLFNQDLNILLEVVENVLTSKAEPIEVPYKGTPFWWAFEHIETKFIDDKKFIYCYLNKFRDVEYKQFIRDTGESTTNRMHDIVIDQSLFVFNPDSEYILFEERDGISALQFCHVFSKLLEENGPLRKVTTEVLTTKETFIQKIQSLDRITSARFVLIPSNPDDSPLYELLDRELRKMQITSTEMIHKGEDLKYEGTLLEQAALSVSEGNGKAVFVGEKDGKTVKVRSKDYRINYKLRSDDLSLFDRMADIILEKYRLKKRNDHHEQRHS